MTFILPSFGASAISAVPGGASAWNGNSYALDFDGTDDYMSLGNITAINSVANASYSFWYKSSVSSTLGLMGGGQGTSVYQWSNHGKLYANAWSADYHELTIPTLGAWHHIVNTFDAGVSKLYLDGSLQSTVNTGTTTASTSGNNFAVGKQIYNGLAQGQKLIDEVALFTSTLSVLDVTAIYNSGPADLTSYSPVGWWRMGDNDSGTGTTITDQGSGGNDGTIVNGSSGNTSPTYSTDVP
jgi:hypothetical protein